LAKKSGFFAPDRRPSLLRSALSGIWGKSGPMKAKPPKEPKPKRTIPFAFVLEELGALEPYTKPMFGCTAIYSGEKILFILRQKNDFPNDSGIWVATFPEHHESLRKELPSLRSLEMFGPGPTSWQNIPEQSDSFEEEALHACALALKNDPRIGKVPARKRPKKKSEKTKRRTRS
jgi:hypothetical protein